jgi:hypothetical protein
MQMHVLYAENRLIAIRKLEELWKEYGIVAEKEESERKANRRAAMTAEKHD